MKKLIVNDAEIDYELREKGEYFEVTMGDQTYCFRPRGQIGAYFYAEDENGRMHRLLVSPKRDHFLAEGELFHVAPLDLTRKRKKKEDHGQMVSPMPGKVLKLVASEGQKVSAGDALLVLEAMKMEHTIRAAHDGVVEKIHFAAGESVEGGVDLVDVKKEEANA